jgi:site-specific DNA-methyltransferase (adenine-specific)
MYQIYNQDCIEFMKTLPDDSVDMCLTDPPYGTTKCKWDIVIPFEPLWEQLKRVVKDNGAIVLFGSQPFTSVLIMSNVKMFKYEWIWEKAAGSNFALVKYQPLKEHENILVFGKNKVNYYPIKEPRKGSGYKRLEHGYKSNGTVSEVTGIVSNRKGKVYDDLKNPSSVQYFNNRESTRGLHPTQKPVALLEYLIKTYSLEGEVVLDFTMGSGSTGVACLNTGRKFIGCELDGNYFEIAKNRLEQVDV